MASARRCLIIINKRNAPIGTVVSVPATLEELLKTAETKLGVTAKKAFTENGAVIDDTALIRDEEKVYISGGEGFWKYDDSKVRTYKLAVLGAGGVGKSCLSLRYTKNAFVDVYDPTIEDAFRHQTTVDGNPCMLDILDTAGQDDMKMLRRQWVQDRDGFLLVFSVLERRSFEELASFLNLIRTVKPGKTVPLVVVANKADMKVQRQVTAAEAQEFARQNAADYIETSARAGTNVNEAFDMLIRLWNKIDGVPASSDDSGGPGSSSDLKKSGKSSGGKSCTLL